MADAQPLEYAPSPEGVPDNDLRPRAAIAERMRLGETDPAPASPPQQPVLIATGTQDPIHDQSAHLASLLPQGEFADIPGRHHVNAPGARTFREAGLEFLGRAR